jgi:asparagine synthetase B (glutamine-hydrolysing)
MAGARPNYVKIAPVIEALRPLDTLTMAHSVEARVPFLDHDVVDFATKLPASYKLSDATCKKDSQEGGRAES